jgi:hypothetical protein
MDCGRSVGVGVSLCSWQSELVGRCDEFKDWLIV